MKYVTLKLLNEIDDPTTLGGILVNCRGTSELWQFGREYANRRRLAKTVDGKWKTWVKWDSDFGGWDSEYANLEPISADDGENPGASDAATPVEDSKPSDDTGPNEFLAAYRRGMLKADGIQNREAPLVELLSEVEKVLDGCVSIERDTGSKFYEVVFGDPHSSRRARIYIYPHEYTVQYMLVRRYCPTVADLRVAILEMLEDPEMHRKGVEK